MANRRLAWLVTAGGILAAALACPAPKTPEEPTGTIDEDVLEDLPCVGARPLPAEPDLIALDAIARTTLDASRRQGAIVVRYKGKGCDLRLDVLPNCSVTGAYAFAPYSSSETKVAHSLSELYTDFPLGASRLASRFKDNPALRADIMLSGIHTLKPQSTFRADELRGECAGATHVVSKIFVGAFALAVGNAHGLEARPSLFAGGAESKASAGVIQKEGSAKACEESQDKGTESSACDVPLRLGLSPIGAACTEDGGPCATATAPVAPVDAGPAPIPSEAGVPPGGTVHIAGGTFTMGPKTRIALANDPMLHTAKVAAFDIDVNEVTVGDYQKCVDGGLCIAPPTDQPTCNYGHLDRANHPMNCVNYTEASAYCHSVGKRLPSEEEWEFAARGGAEERSYPWGSAEPSKQLCWSGLTKLDGTCPIRIFAPGAFGIYDMAGNVSEWTTSPYSAERKDARVTRGGGWPDARALNFRGAYRVAHAPSNRDSDLGFRCVRGP
jgi:formylglycine-generating enzyme required for sulfatase activity